MSRWRYALIAAYGLLGLSGAWLLTFTQRKALGAGLLAAGTLAILVHMGLERRQAQRESASRLEWVRRVRAVADDISLGGYGIEDLEGLARYHDAAGRAAVMAELQALPPGRRSLLEAARRVDPDAEWD